MTQQAEKGSLQQVAVHDPLPVAGEFLAHKSVAEIDKEVWPAPGYVAQRRLVKVTVACLIQMRIGLDGEGLAAFRRDRAALRKQADGLANRRAALPPELAAKLAKLSERYPSLNFDPATGQGRRES